MAFQIDRYAQLLQEIHSEDSVDLAATRFADSAQVSARCVLLFHSRIGRGPRKSPLAAAPVAGIFQIPIVTHR